jgi:hypothetical protein
MFDPSILREGERCAVCGQLNPQLLRVYQLRGLDGLVPAETVLCHNHAMPLLDMTTITADGAIVTPTRKRVLDYWAERRNGRNVLLGGDRRHEPDRRYSRRGGLRDRRRAFR